MNKISIIIPVYNVQPYLERCIKSILKQTYSNWECLIIDDGSTDPDSYVTYLHLKIIESRCFIKRMKDLD